MPARWATDSPPLPLPTPLPDDLLYELVHMCCTDTMQQEKLRTVGLVLDNMRPLMKQDRALLEQQWACKDMHR